MAGSLGCWMAAAAIANALFDATGVRLREVPFRAERVTSKLREQRGQWYAREVMNRALEMFDRVIIWILVAMMVLAIIAATADLVWVFVTDLLSAPFDFLTVTELLDVFGALLIVLIGLELLETVKVYAREHRVQVETVLLVSLIAVLRKVITLDLKTAPPVTLLAVAGLVGALAGAYWLMRKSVHGAENSDDSTKRGPR